jgi:hypothetical protein
VPSLEEVRVPVARAYSNPLTRREEILEMEFLIELTQKTLKIH